MGAYFPGDTGCRRLDDEDERGEARGQGVMLALHRRLGEVNAALEALADSRFEPDPREEARRSLDAEKEALAAALLYQQPNSWRDALLLAHHLSDALKDGSRFATACAAETLFDFLATHVDEDHEPFGEAFQQATVRAFTRCRHRLGHFDR